MTAPPAGSDPVSVAAALLAARLERLLFTLDTGIGLDDNGHMIPKGAAHDPDPSHPLDPTLAGDRLR